MKRGVTLIELVLILVIIGVLMGIGVYSFRLKYLQNDANFIYMDLLQAKYQGVNYDKHFPDLTSTPDSTLKSSLGCIELSESAIKSRAQKAHYQFRSTITIHDSDSNMTLCFDSYGRPHLDDNLTSFSSLLKSKKTLITLKYKKEANITIFPQSGYIQIEK